jgi:aminocarboxymuconate-semialdehyde decarboxylase
MGRKVDTHFHVVPTAFAQAVRENKFRDAVEVKVMNDIEHLVFHAPEGIPVEPHTELEPESYDPKLILKALDRKKLDIAVMSPAPELFIYWASVELSEQIAISMNDAMAALAATKPDRLVGLATLPLQDPDRSVRELERAVRKLGLVGAAICTHVNGTTIDPKTIGPVFAAAQRLDVPLFLHPQNAGDTTRLNDFHLWNMVGFPYETALTASRLLMSGTFETYPRLKVILAHGGGYLPYQIGRLDHGYRAKKSLFPDLPHPPSHYLKNITCDCLVHSQLSMRFLIERFGHANVALGCDYPFNMGSDGVVDSVRELGLPAEQEEAILGENLARLFKLR